jgi:hypothetical protein
MGKNSFRKVKVNLSLCLTRHQARKVYWENGSTTPCILDLDTKWRWVLSFTPRPLYPQGKNALYSFNKESGWAPEPSGGSGEEKNSQPLPGLEHSIIQHVAQSYTTETNLKFTSAATKLIQT